MPVTLQCPGCGGKFREPDENAGTRVKCPKCSALIQVHGAEHPQIARPSDPIHKPSEVPPSLATGPAPSPEKSRSQRCSLVWGWIAVALVTLPIAASVFWLFGPERRVRETSNANARPTAGQSGPAPAAATKPPKVGAERTRSRTAASQAANVPRRLKRSLSLNEKLAKLLTTPFPANATLMDIVTRSMDIERAVRKDSEQDLEGLRAVFLLGSSQRMRLGDSGRPIDPMCFAVCDAVASFGQAAVPYLIDGVRDKENAQVRAWSIHCLGKIGKDAKEALPHLKEALKDESEWVRHAAQKAIEDIGGVETDKPSSEESPTEQEQRPGVDHTSVAHGEKTQPKSGQFQNIHDAAQAGDLIAVKRFVGNGVDVNTGNEEGGWTPLHLASRNGHRDVVQFLIERRADVNAWDHARVGTPLHLAARFGHVPVVKVLVAHGADVNAEGNIKNATPLYMATTPDDVNETTRKEIAAILIQHGAKVPNE